MTEQDYPMSGEEGDVQSVTLTEQIERAIAEDEDFPICGCGDGISGSAIKRAAQIAVAVTANTTKHAEMRAEIERHKTEQRRLMGRIDEKVAIIARLEEEKSGWIFTEKGFLRSIREQESELTAREIALVSNGEKLLAVIKEREDVKATLAAARKTVGE